LAAVKLEKAYGFLFGIKLVGNKAIFATEIVGI
jgi:hypothetical protein